MTHRKTIAAAAALALGVGGAGTALAAAAAPAPNKVTVKGVGSPKFKINRYVQDGTRYDRDVYTVRSGGTLTLLNTQSQEGPHTLTVLRKSKLPRTARAINACGNGVKGSPCFPFGEAHQFNPQTGAVGKPIVDVGKAGLDGPGDSVYVDPKGAPTSKRSIKVSAKKGSTLYFICLIHPWMQAKLQVK